MSEENLVKNGAKNDEDKQRGKSDSSGQDRIRYYGWKKAHYD